MTTSNLPMPPTTADASASPLAQLNDIQLPDPISAMPIAPGYWIIAALIIVIAIWFAYRIYKQYQYHAPRKKALSLLDQYDINDDNFAAQVNSLLKRTAMTYLPRESLAKLNGQPWFDWLDSRLPSKQQHVIGELLFKRHQANGLTADEKQQLALLAKIWLSNKKPFSDPSLTTYLHTQEA
ncbi:DUF4381 domain-containing protein [Shewanella inventionis]|uniref:DUF4381 domain-containing protein n=1 Tax=Shewanella inventionis TaxID=1738770 RepID=A0ABQ1INT9_9GAMM|nr:DUF4381 domain-containing protein [Shewanella inventionis]MCL1159046.1 DUF4381 domain-containing protein [Shewanella inventionis]GGB47479.1 hypothetical protein GCM10011607_04650 [Shewanella inventionis]